MRSGIVRPPSLVGNDRGHDAEVFYLGLALDGGFVEGCPERIGEDDPEDEGFLRGVWEDGDDRDFVPDARGRGGREGGQASP